LLVPALGVASIFLGRQDRGAAMGGTFPWFVIGFLIVAILGSLVALPVWLTVSASKAAGAMLLLAVVATGIRSPMQLLLQQGWRASLPVAVATLISFCASMIAAQLL
jgi:uncharacterized membrane protein YadS